MLLRPMGIFREYESGMTARVAVVGASGYAGGELLRLLAGHPQCEVRTATAFHHAGKPVVSVHPHLRDYAHMSFTDTTPEHLVDHDIVFVALPHGTSGGLTATLPLDVLVVDCGADHRLERSGDWAAFYDGPYAPVWEYGVPELPRLGTPQRARLASTRRVAAPGCNASTMALSLAPGIAAGVIAERDVVSVLAVGTSGAGRVLKPHLLASEVTGSASVYSVAGTHRHVPEVLQAMRWAGATDPSISFTPVLVPMSRGILATTSAALVPGTSAERMRAAWVDAYAGESFVQVLPEGQFPRVSDVVGSNLALIGVALDEAVQRVVIVAALDNLVKGTAGAAIQSANVAFGFPETTGLTTNGVAP